MATYNGYKNWTTWNLTLWANNTYETQKALYEMDFNTRVKTLRADVVAGYKGYIKGFLTDCAYLGKTTLELMQMIDFKEVAESFED